MALIKGFFFDLDGTLVDTHHANFEAYRLAIAEHGVDITFDAFKKTIGMQAQDFLPMLAPHLNKEQYLAISETKAKYYKDTMAHTRLNEQLVGFMRYLSSHYIIALVTTAKRENAETVLRHHNLHDTFKIIVTTSDVTKSKPSPESYLLALKQTGLQANEVIAFEDSQSGIEAATAAGISVVKINDFLL